MNLAAAIAACTEGKRVKLPEWQGYWFSSENKVKAFLADGSIAEDPWFDKYEGRTDFEITEGNLGFDFAIRALKSGKKVARIGWNGKGMWLEFIKATEYQIDGHNLPVNTAAPDGNVQSLLPFICMKTADNKYVPWLASQTDVLAEDWVVINR